LKKFHFILIYLPSALRVRLEEIQEVSYRQSDKIIALRSVAKVDFSSVPTKIIKLYKLYLKYCDYPHLKKKILLKIVSNDFFPSQALESENELLSRDNGRHQIKGRDEKIGTQVVHF
jgi:hypothetical protein